MSSLGWRQFVKFRLLLTEAILALMAVGVGILMGGVLVWIVGEDPVKAILIIFEGAFGTAYDLGMVLYFATILIATGLSVAIPSQTGNFNIGAEGQTLMGALAAGVVGAYGPANLPHGTCLTLAILAALLASGLWGAIAAAIRSYRGGHEVIASIMLNFIAAGVSGWLVVTYFQAPDSQNPETITVPEVFQLHRFDSFDGAPATMAIFIALAFAFCFWLVLERMRPGFVMKAVKQSPEAAIVAGYSPNKAMFWSFTIGSAMCGLAGAVMVLGESWRFRLEISDGFGFLGIPVALLGRSRPLGVVLSAFLFASLHHGSSLLDIESTKIGRDLAQVIEAIVVLSVVSMVPLLRFMTGKFSTRDR